MYQKITIVGRIGQDPEIRQVNDTTVANFSVATNEHFGSKRDDSYQEHTEWHDCAAWANDASRVEQLAEGGTLVLVDGVMRKNEWEDRDGNKRSKRKIRVSSIQFIADLRPKPEQEMAGANGDGFEPDDELPW